MSCLDDLPGVVERYDYLLAGGNRAPGDSIKSTDQCQKAFGPKFRPHVKDEKPFEVSGRTRRKTPFGVT